MPFRLSSPVFIDGGHIPATYSCEGEDVSPPLAWSGAPAGTESFVLLLDDPDAPGGTWHHWAVYNIPPSADHLEREFPPDGPYPQAINDFGKPGYGGPCPPKGGGFHHYRFRLLALGVPALGLPANVTCRAVETAATAHKLAKAEIIGVFARD
ncbi:MAG TPA: YbhB/YbcL family Raf kinase inhibitor-like protein [Alphaproteobacteria bacterium]|nr:YbhB/YbcL family Raf kinase inhibitor-like protein [Alphaproteobacteria bacterium]